ncbi:hypothetical protein KUV57_12295 [Epibacterium sp. DP7N7-1]|nr:hypothetical protein [Epibacterium sp. DP7N7-1]
MGPVTDPYTVAPDLEFVADPAEIDGCDWHLQTVRIHAIYPAEELDEGRALPGETPEEAAARWASLRAWIIEAGGPAAAFAASPIIALQDGEDMVPIDGWHRCVVAWHDHGLRELPCLVGIPTPDVKLSPSL